MEHLFSEVGFTGFSRRNIAVTGLLGFVLQLANNTKCNGFANQIDKHLNRLRKFLLLFWIIDVDDLFFGVHLSQRLLSSNETDVIDDSEARQWDFLRLVLRVVEKVLTLLVGDVDRFTILTATSISQDGD